MHKTRENNTIGLLWVLAIFTFAFFMGGGFLPKEGEEVDWPKGEIQEFAVACYDGEWEFTAYYLSEKPESLDFERGLCESRNDLVMKVYNKRR